MQPDLVDEGVLKELAFHEATSKADRALKDLRTAMDEDDNLVLPTDPLAVAAYAAIEACVAAIPVHRPTAD